MSSVGELNFSLIGFILQVSMIISYYEEDVLHVLILLVLLFLKVTAILSDVLRITFLDLFLFDLKLDSLSTLYYMAPPSAIMIGLGWAWREWILRQHKCIGLAQLSAYVVTGLSIMRWRFFHRSVWPIVLWRCWFLMLRLRLCSMWVDSYVGVETFLRCRLNVPYSYACCKIGVHSYFLALVDASVLTALYCSALLVRLLLCS